MEKETTGVIIFKATLLIALISFLSKLLGLLRDIVIARQFGASSATDAYLVALTAPNLLFFIISGSLAAVIVPVFVDFTARDQKKEAWKVFNTVFNVSTIIFIVIAVMGMLGSSYIVRLVAPFFEKETAVLAAELTRLMFPLLIFAGWASLFTGLLNANNIFGIPPFSNVVNNLVIILAALTLGSVYGVQGLAVGTVLAMAAMALVQVPALLSAGYRYRPELQLGHLGVKKVFSLILPAVLAITVNQAYILIEKVIASGMPAGSIAALNFANKLVQFPVSLLVLALGTAVFPTLTKMATHGESKELSAIIIRLLKLLILGMFPACAGLMVLRYPIVSLLFQRGAFDRWDTELTAVALLFYSVGLAGQAANIILTKAFYSLQDTRTPVKITLFTVLVNLGLSLVLIRYLQHGGLALANSLASLTGTALFMIYLEKKIEPLEWTCLAKFSLPVLIASGLMAAASYFVSIVVSGYLDLSNTFGLAVQVGAAMSAGVAVFAAAAFIFKIEEFSSLLTLLRGALNGRSYRG
ncbi:MAG: putative peptidoglycan biosynthesis protein MurJ [Pelotomaculum sp. PtaB.Bin104]|nr:MAG: putative peptidoglycan biosynthesis protein MurJ [Pelotomaculum sp. PtaB.Bin104]